MIVRERNCIICLSSSMVTGVCTNARLVQIMILSDRHNINSPSYKNWLPSFYCYAIRCNNGSLVGLDLFEWMRNKGDFCRNCWRIHRSWRPFEAIDRSRHDFSPLFSCTNALGRLCQGGCLFVSLLWLIFCNSTAFAFVNGAYFLTSDIDRFLLLIQSSQNKLATFIVANPVSCGCHATSRKLLWFANIKSIPVCKLVIFFFCACLFGQSLTLTC